MALGTVDSREKNRGKYQQRYTLTKGLSAKQKKKKKYCLLNGCWYGKEMLGCKRKENKSQNLRGRGWGGKEERTIQKKTKPTTFCE